jgi:hypothetical protein
MIKFTSSLDNIKIASPCSQDWEAMIGNERQRHCGDCRLNVYNLSGMTRLEAENFLINAEGRVCVRFFKRADGSILTTDCPVGWQAVKRRVSKIATAFASLIFAVLSGIGLTNYFAKLSEQHTMGTIMPKIENTIMGAVAVKETNPIIGNLGNQKFMGGLSSEQYTRNKISNIDTTKRQIIKKHGR